MVRMFAPGSRLGIRLSRIGRRNNPRYHIVVQDTRRKPNSRAIVERIGTMNPVRNKDGYKECQMDFQRALYWMSQGAQPTRAVYQLMHFAGFLPAQGTTLPKDFHRRKFDLTFKGFKRYWFKKHKINNPDD